MNNRNIPKDKLLKMLQEMVEDPDTVKVDAHDTIDVSFRLADEYKTVVFGLTLGPHIRTGLWDALGSQSSFVPTRGGLPYLEAYGRARVLVQKLLDRGIIESF